LTEIVLKSPNSLIAKKAVLGIGLFTYKKPVLAAKNLAANTQDQGENR
jgi:hypothetical protein